MALHDKGPAIDRFLEKLELSGKRDDCWIWTAANGRGGYGRFRADGRMVSAHRFSYDLFNGPIPAGLHVCHRCDVPACVNPEHLFVGTPADNQREMLEKGRAVRLKGSDHGQARLHENDVRAIRVCYANGGVLQREIATWFGVSHQTISKAINRQKWSHI